MKPMKYNARRRKRASIEDLEKFADGDFDIQSPGPRPNSAKRRAPRRDRTVAADEAAIAALPTDGTRQRFRVAGHRGLFVRIEPSGRRTYQAVRYVNGQQGGRWIGNVGKISLREAVLGRKIAELRWRVAELESRVAELETELQEARGEADA